MLSLVQNPSSSGKYDIYCGGLHVGLVLVSAQIASKFMEDVSVQDQQLIQDIRKHKKVMSVRNIEIFPKYHECGYPLKTLQAVESVALVLGYDYTALVESPSMVNIMNVNGYTPLVNSTQKAETLYVKNLALVKEFSDMLSESSEVMQYSGKQGTGSQYLMSGLVDAVRDV